MNWLTRFWTWIDERAIMRRILLLVTLYLTYKSSIWAMDFSHESRTGLDIAAIIAAVLAPVNALQAYVFKFYLESRKDA